MQYMFDFCHVRASLDLGGLIVTRVRAMTCRSESSRHVYEISAHMIVYVTLATFLTYATLALVIEHVTSTPALI